jgi:hypothetical protein
MWREADVMFSVLAALFIVSSSLDPRPVGRLIDLGGHRLHLHCTGRGRPTVVIETGLGDFSFDWILVQQRVERDLRVCTYDRAGYAWSDPGPLPRTFDQLNLELHDALARAGEHALSCWSATRSVAARSARSPSTTPPTSPASSSSTSSANINTFRWVPVMPD